MAELEFEKKTGLELYNPFYDTERDDIVDIDSGKTTRWEIPCKPIVEKDILQIMGCDAFLLILTEETLYGSLMEMVYAYIHHKPIYVIDIVGNGKHPWIRYHATRIFDSWGAFADAIACEQ